MSLFNRFLKKKEDAHCPYCDKELELVLTKKKACPFCKKLIFVRTDPKNQKKVLVTEKGVIKIEEEWKHYLGLNRWLGNLGSFGITKKDFELKKIGLTHQFKREPYPRDVIWGLLNHLLIETMKQNNFQKLSGIYYSMALFLDEEDKSPNEMLTQNHRMQLLYYQNEDLISGVEILAQGCENCKSQNGRVFSIKEAIENTPLPNKACTFKFSKQSKYCFCRCCYLPKLTEVK